MAEYLVTWEINITADSPKEAAIIALKMQRDPSSIATVFAVEPQCGCGEYHGKTFDVIDVVATVHARN